MKVIIYAFTGTHRGMSAKQLERLFEVWGVLRPDIVTNGCCEGADRQLHGVAAAQDIATEFFPSNPEQREWAESVQGIMEVVHRVEPPLKRNRSMVATGRRGLVAAPYTVAEITRSGTWATVRYARNVNRPIWIIYPNGDLEVE